MQGGVGDLVPGWTGVSVVEFLSDFPDSVAKARCDCSGGTVALVDVPDVGAWHDVRPDRGPVCVPFLMIFPRIGCVEGGTSTSQPREFRRAWQVPELGRPTLSFC